MEIKIKGLYAVWNLSPGTPYLVAVSLNEDVLQNILKKLNEEVEFEDGYYSIREVTLFIVTTIKDNDKILISRALSYSEDFIKDKIFAMNKNNNVVSLVGTPDTTLDQVLIKITHDSDECSDEYKDYVNKLRNNKLFEEDNFSENPIQFDKYYEEGVVNA